MTERPFFLNPAAPKPDNNLNDYTATLGGPLVKDRCALLRRLRIRRPGPARREQGDPVFGGRRTPRFSGCRPARFPTAASSRPSRTCTSRLARPTPSCRPSTGSARATSSSRTPRPSTSAAASTPPSAPPTSTTDGLGLAAAGVVVRRARASTSCACSTRSATSSARSASRRRTSGPAVLRERHRRLRPAARRQPVGRLRLQPEDLAGGRQLLLDRRSAQLQGRLRRAVRSTTSASTRCARSTRSPTSRLSRREERRQPARLHHLHPGRRRPGGRLQLALHGLLPAGRLPLHAQLQAALRRALRPVRHPRLTPVRRQPALAEVHGRQEQLRAARGLRLDPRPGRARRCCAARAASCTSRRC